MLFPTSDVIGTDMARRFFNAADRTKMLRRQRELDALAQQDKAFLANEEQLDRLSEQDKAFLANEEQLDRLSEQDKAFLANEETMGVDDLSNYERQGVSFAEATPEIPKEDLDWFKKETGTAFNPNSVADVYYLMNRKYNKVSEAKATELERKRQKGSSATNLSRVQKMKNPMR